MSLRIGNLLEMSLQYIRHKVQKAKSGFDDAPDPAGKYRLSVEPPSAMFTHGATVTIEGVENPRDPLEAVVMSSVRGQWRQQAVDMISKLKSHGIDLRDYTRSGGVYQSSRANKKVAKQHKFFNFLMQTGLDFWRCAEWEEVAKPKTLQLLADYDERDQRNLVMLSQDPTSLTVGKPEKTGTGYEFPFDTRIAMQENFEEALPMLKDTCSTFMKDLAGAVEHWPEKGATINIAGSWKGVEGGRSDADVMEWSGDGLEDQKIGTKTRDVGTVPTSPLHNRPLDPPAFQQELWQRHTTPYHILPMDIEGPALALTTPPATIPSDDGEAFAMISADFGPTGNPPVYDGKRMIVPKEVIALGADNVTLFGINLYSIVSNKYFGMLVSGAPFTMIIYLVMVGWVIASWAQRHGIPTTDMRIWQIGDDLQIIIRRKHIPALLARFGPWLRVKGMKVTPAGHSYFVTGKYVVWHEDGTITVFMAPRILKSVTSASQTKDNAMVPENPKIGDVIDMYFDDEELDESIDAYWRDYGWSIYYHGTPEDYYELMMTQGADAFAEQAALDPGSWYAEMYGEEKLAAQKLREDMDRPGTPEPQFKEEAESIPEAAHRQDAAAGSIVGGQSAPSSETDEDTTSEETDEKGEDTSEDAENAEEEESNASEEFDDDTNVKEDDSDVVIPADEKPKILIGGCPGAGKSTIVKAAAGAAVDMDQFGTWTDAAGITLSYGTPEFEEVEHPKWQVDKEKLSSELNSKDIAAGNADNLFEDSYTQDKLIDLFDKVYWLIYSPSEEEVEKRFSSERTNPFGKSPEEQEMVKSCLAKRPSVAHEVVDTTGWTEDDLISWYDRVVRPQLGDGHGDDD